MDEPLRRVGRARRFERRVGRIFLAAVAAFGLVAAGVYARSESVLGCDYSVLPALTKLEVSTRTVSLERGRRLTTILSQCTHCHGSDLGGAALANDPWIGRLDAPNLTRGRGGVPDDYSRDDWVRAIRFGVGRDGRSLLLMPSGSLSQISDADLVAMIDYLENVPRVDRARNPRRIGWLTRVALAAGFATDLLAAPTVNREGLGPIEQTEEVSVEYGGYLVDLGSCRICHHADLRGGRHPLALPGEPTPPDLRVSGPLSKWDRDDFDRAMRSGKTPSGRQLDREFMPWPRFAALSELEMDALWMYLRTESGDEQLSMR